MNEIQNRSFYQPATYAMNMYSRPASGNQITWVMGIENAKTFPIAPNSTILLMDSEAQKFYIKTSDINGMCTLTSYDFVKTPEAAAPQPLDESKYLTKKEFYDYINNLTAPDTNKQ